MAVLWEEGMEVLRSYLPVPVPAPVPLPVLVSVSVSVSGCVLATW